MRRTKGPKRQSAKVGHRRKNFFSAALFKDAAGTKPAKLQGLQHGLGGKIFALASILCGLFEPQGNVSPSEVQSTARVIITFVNLSPKRSIHVEICGFNRAVTNSSITTTIVMTKS